MEFSLSICAEFTFKGNEGEIISLKINEYFFILKDHYILLHHKIQFMSIKSNTVNYDNFPLNSSRFEMETCQYTTTIEIPQSHKVNRFFKVPQQY